MSFIRSRILHTNPNSRIHELLQSYLFHISESLRIEKKVIDKNVPHLFLVMYRTASEDGDIEVSLIYHHLTNL
jgi:hypothetical protein